MNICIIPSFFVFILVADSFESIHSSTLKDKQVEAQELQHNEGKYLVYITHKNVHKFSGFLISENSVLTAAHNLQEFWTEKIIPWFEDYSVVVGSFNESITGRKHSIEQVQAYRYYEYKNLKPAMDLALIRLLEPVEKSNFGDWIDLAVNHSFCGFEKSFGWGWTFRKGEESSAELSIPTKVDVEIKMNYHCRGALNSNVFCVKASNPAVSFSEEDVGTPLVQNKVALGMYTKNANSGFFIYTAFTSAKIANIKKMQTSPENIQHFMRFCVYRAPRAIARWEQNYTQSRKKQRT